MHSPRSSYERTLLDLSLKQKTVYCTQRYTSLCWFFSVQIQPPFFAFLDWDWTLLSCFSADGNTADILMFMHNQFTHTTKQHKHNLKHKKMENFPISYAYAYVYVAPVHTYNSYAYVYAYAYVAV